MSSDNIEAPLLSPVLAYRQRLIAFAAQLHGLTTNSPSVSSLRALAIAERIELQETIEQLTHANDNAELNSLERAYSELIERLSEAADRR
jgi:hypothetical protein